ncbi:hypothetical protein F5Y16DRAFT_424542 [Xylariaceae sp. FL0255]|nr:hypothetical protein F5Y16DRAFT_424542 [Xylariaceae sp. FL0255]
MSSSWTPINPQASLAMSSAPVTQSPFTSLATTARTPLPSLASGVQSSLPHTGSPGSSSGSSPAQQRQQRRPRPPKKSNTAKERAKGDLLSDDDIGTPATQKCTRCAKSGKDCRVAWDPYTFDSFNCNCCIRNKQKCSFSCDNPGIDYDNGMKRHCHSREEKKRRGRESADATLREKKEKGRKTTIEYVLN